MAIKDTFTNRLNRAMYIRNVKQIELSRATDIGKSSISQYCSGVYEPKQTALYKIAKALNVNEAWLMGYDVPMDRTIRSAKESPATYGEGIPLLGTIAAGTPILAEENIEGYFSLDRHLRADFALRIKGDSMIGANINEGDIVFLRQQSTLENGEIGAVLIENEATLKKFYRDDGTVVLQAENDKYKPIVLTNGKVKILGKLVAILNIKS